MSALSSPTEKYHKTTYPSLDPTRQELSAKGKTIVISGGGTGIGAETAKYFAKAGASRIAILGRREQPLLDTKASIEAEYPGTKIFAIVTDATKTSQVDAAFAEVAGDGKVDVLISNAAVMGKQGHVADLSTEDFLSGIVMNLQANFNLSKTFIKYATTDAVLIETNSAAAYFTMGDTLSSYCVAKAATARFYTALAIEHPQLSIFSVHPGVVATAMAKETGFENNEGQDGGGVQVNFDDPSLPASFMVWVASPEARFLKGKFLWANWDVNELKARATEIENGHLLSIGLGGSPFAYQPNNIF